MLSLLATSLFAQEGGTATQKAGSGFSFTDPAFLLTMVVAFVVMQLLVVGPQKKKEKELAAQKESLKKGVEVVTIGGICGTVKRVEEERVVLKLDSSSTITVLKSAIATIKNDDESNSEKSA